jgi:endonuclease/exonuclease/phosphatase family metal-dependent hydrolase
MREVAALHPDVVLLQESPTARDVEKFGRELFGADAGVFVGFDAAIIVDGNLEAAVMPPNHRAYFVRGRASIRGGPAIDVFSLRLTPACVRTDLWSPDCWREHIANRELRRSQLRVVAEEARKAGGSVPIVLGGDFNAPQDDAVFDLLRPFLRDTFKSAGSGWGNTITNDMPVLRIDQIWASPSLQATAVITRKTAESDHRMVAADLILPNAAGN